MCACASAGVCGEGGEVLLIFFSKIQHRYDF